MEDQMSDAVAAGRGLRIPVAHRSPVKAVAGAGTARGRGLIVTAGGDGKIRSWVADSGEAAEFVASDDGNSVSFLAVADVAGARLIISGDHTAVRRFDMASGEEVGQPLRVPGTEWVRFGGLGPVAVHADSDEVLLVAGGINGRVHRWNLVTGELLGQSVGGHDGKVLSVDVMRLRSGRFVIVSGGVDGLVLRWDAATGEPIGEPMPGNRAPVTAFACVSGAAGRDVVIGQEYRGPIHLWDAVTGQPIVAPLPQAGHGVSSGGMAVTPDGRVLLSLDAGGTPWLWDLASAEPVAEPLSVPVPMVNAVAVVPSLEGPLFVTGGGSGQLRRWDVAGRAVGDDMPGHPAPVADVFGALASPPVGRPGSAGVRRP
jgi:WD40 repeat protein